MSLSDDDFYEEYDEGESPKLDVAPEIVLKLIKVNWISLGIFLLLGLIHYMLGVGSSFFFIVLFIGVAFYNPVLVIISLVHSITKSGTGGLWLAVLVNGVLSGFLLYISVVYRMVLIF